MSNVAANVPPTPIAVGVGPLPSEWRSFFTTLLSRTGGGSGGGGIPGTITSSQISDSTPIGRDLLTAQSALLAREVIGAGTSDLTVETVAESVVGGTVVASYDAGNGTWSMTLRPTGVAAGTYTSVQVEADGRVTGGSPASDALDYATALAYGL